MYCLCTLALAEPCEEQLGAAAPGAEATPSQEEHRGEGAGPPEGLTSQLGEDTASLDPWALLMSVTSSPTSC